MLDDVRVRDFRCFDALDFELAKGMTFLIGANAQGKTSLLEAMCVLLRLQSPRASSLAEMVRFDTAGFGLDGHWKGRHLHVKFTNALKAFALDSKPQSRSADYLAVAKVAWISNADLQLVSGGGSQRRRFMDFLGAQCVPNYLRHLRAYERALRSRNALLKEGRSRREVEAFDGPLLETGTFLLEAREKLTEGLAPCVARACRKIAGEGEMLQVFYRPGCKEDFATALAESREEEMRLRVTQTGPHRDDLEILLNGRAAAVFGSEGQQRSAALVLKLAQADKLDEVAGAPPLYLIDDVFGELDVRRRNNLLLALPGSAQKVITCTTLDWLEAPQDAAVFSLKDGRMEQER